MEVDEVIKFPEMLRDCTLERLRETLEWGPTWREEALGKGSHRGEGWVLREYSAA
jgi:hypothetical protein